MELQTGQAFATHRAHGAGFSCRIRLGSDDKHIATVDADGVASLLFKACTNGERTKRRMLAKAKQIVALQSN
jgi:hypothetical protein